MLFRSAAASHLSHAGAVAQPMHASEAVVEAVVAAATHTEAVTAEAAASNVIAMASWAADAQKELQKIPFFVRGKARRNTERFAAERGLATITVDTLYDAKAHFGR